MSDDIKKLYKELNPSSGYIESMQMGTRHFGDDSEVLHWSGNDSGSKGERCVDWGYMDHRMAGVFSQFEEAKGFRGNDAYVWIEQDKDSSRLCSSGSSHGDWVGRDNSHYFVAVGEAEKLEEVVRTFIEDPRNLEKFSSEIFGWENGVPRAREGQPNLFSRMKNLYVKTPLIEEMMIDV